VCFEAEERTQQIFRSRTLKISMLHHHLSMVQVPFILHGISEYLYTYSQYIYINIIFSHDRNIFS
jgi:hypothetical protein